MPDNRWNIAQFFEIRWWKRYLRGKDVNSYLTWKRDYWQQFLQKLDLQIPDIPAMRILDAGCGPAGIFMHFSQAPVTAIDPLLEAYTSLGHFNPGWYKNVTFQPVPLESMASGPSFDVVFCLNVINHVQDIRSSLQKLYDLTRESGTCVISIDTHKNSTAKKILRTLPLDILHPYQYDMAEYEELFEEAGFKMVRQKLLKKGRVFDYRVFVLEK